MKVYSTKNISPYELLKMPGEVAICLLKANVERPAPIWSTTLEFVFLSVVVLLGLILNYGFLKKLKKEKHRSYAVIIRLTEPNYHRRKGGHNSANRIEKHLV